MTDLHPPEGAEAIREYIEYTDVPLSHYLPGDSVRILSFNALAEYDRLYRKALERCLVALQFLEMDCGCPSYKYLPHFTSECDGDDPTEDCQKCWARFLDELAVRPSPEED